MNKLTGWVLVGFMAFMLFGAWRASEVANAKGLPLIAPTQEEKHNYKTDDSTLNDEKSSEVIAKMDKVLGGQLKNTGKYFYKYGTQYNVNPTLLAAIAVHETANGREVVGNNVGGIYDENTNKFRTYKTIDQSIKDMAVRIKANYIDEGLTNIEEIGQAYAPIGADNDPNGMNASWTPRVTKYYQLMR